MKKFLLAPLTALLFGCAINTVRPVPPQPGGGTCESADANLKTLGGCGMPMDTFTANCHEREAFDASRSRVLPLDCLTNAANCDAALACRS